MNAWFRSWHGAPTDPKWLAIAQRAQANAGERNVTQCNAGTVSAVFWALMDCASQADDRGSVASFDPESYAAFSGFDSDTVTAIVLALRDKNMIEGDHLTAWERRQPKREDDSSGRVKKWRERNVTQRNTNEHREEEIRLDKKEDTARAVTPNYAFESGVIRLSAKDLEKWKSGFSCLDVPAELLGLTQWAGMQPNWFHAVSGALAKRNREVGERRTASLNGPPPRPLSPFGTKYPDGII